MAVFNIDYYMKSLKRKANFIAVLPVDTTEADMPLQKYKSVYLLHGFSGNCTDWVQNAPLSELAVKYNVVFILPSGENGFYLNNDAVLYEDYVCKELPEICRRFLPVSDKAEDTVIAGLSMGGFGAIHSGLAYPETFGSIIALSSALITDNISIMKEGENNGVASYEYYRHTFGCLDKLTESHNNPKVLIKKLKESEGKTPGIYMACGREDFLISENRDFHNYLQQLDIKHEYVEDTGSHDWDFWRKYLQKSLEWKFGEN